MTMVVGMEIKGARRWISLPGMSVQPSEFLKPCFAVTAAWLLSEGRKSRHFPGMLLAGGICALILVLLKSQPDIGMLAVITVVFLAQLYINGLPLILVGVAIGLISGGGVLAYTVLPHVRYRFDDVLEGRGRSLSDQHRAGGPSATAASSAAAPVRGTSRTSCPMRTPTLSTPWLARNSAC